MSTVHYHRIRWNVPYKSMVRIAGQFCSMSTVTYVKSLEKAIFLRQYYYHGEMIDLKNIEAPFLRPLHLP